MTSHNIELDLTCTFITGINTSLTMNSDVGCNTSHLSTDVGINTSAVAVAVGDETSMDAQPKVIIIFIGFFTRKSNCPKSA